MPRTSRTIAACALALLAGAALAQDDAGSKWPGKSWSVSPGFNQRFTVFGGAGYTFVDATVQGQDRTDGSGAEIDLDDVGVDDGDWSPLIGGQLRFGTRRNWKLDAVYFSTDVDGSATLGGTIEYEGVVFPVGGNVESEFSTDILIASLGWAPFKADNYELGIGGGVHLADVEAKFQGAGFVGNSPVTSVTSRTDTLAPLPNFWVYGGYAFTPKLSVEAAFGWLSLEIDKYDGEILTAMVQGQYRFRERIGIGAGFRYIDTDLTVDGSNYKDKYDFNYYGPFLFMTIGF